MVQVDKLWEQYLPGIEEKLHALLPEKKGWLAENLQEAMRYSVFAGGKRIRAVLVLEFCRACGGDPAVALPFACAIEMIHTYSLIHDDLPCMDDDDLRRGKPSNHKVFGEDIALLAGDALLTKAFEVMLSVVGKDAEEEIRFRRAASVLAQAAGSEGMVGGQVLALNSEGKNVPLEVLRELDEGKTIALIRAACRMGCILAGASEKMLTAADQYGYNIGLAFQIVDDILDIIGDTALLGKKIGSDAQNEKSTYVSLLGIDKAQQMADQLTDEACAALECFGAEGEALQALGRFLAVRKH